MKKIYRTDIFLIALGLATLVVQRFFLNPEEADAESHMYTQSQLRAEVGQEPVRAEVVREPEWSLTFPAGSAYQDLTPPQGVMPNPFQEVQRIAKANEGENNYAGKDTDMRQLLLAHAGKDYLFVLQQQAANEMLRHELFQHYYQDPTQPNVLEVIGFYTEQLVEAKSEDAKLMYMCLRALKEHWPAQKISQVALATAARVQARKIHSAEDTATVTGYHRQVYARELKKLGHKLKNRA
ncbi:hypothetical protein [Rufibacter tibetensis]|uniref:Uncharacterized protein n=1 Tax=Rufibacter tibetensis TaxID=512763 RepID=A0A0P0CVV8_9BACT|nr:hypothetical protein [Rufibacter tibetensis]ALI98649.1 hypothetical protein DC20_06295 [Rufibacter tibetensis]